MGTLIAVYHNGLVITNEIGSYEFIRMRNETFLLNEFATLENLVGLEREQLDWIEDGFDVRFEGRINIGSSNGPQMATISPVCNEKE
jgi:hypothetical protein